MNTLEQIPYKMAENTSFLWVLYSQAQSRRDYNQTDLDELRGRIDSQTEGLDAYGDEAWAACEESLDFEDAGEVFTAATVALRSHCDDQIKSDRLRKVVTAACTTDESFDGLVGAFAWQPFTDIQSWVSKFLRSGNPIYCSLGVAVCGAHKKDCGSILNTYLTQPKMQESPDCFWRILKAVGELRRRDLLIQLKPFRDADDPRIAFWSSWSSVLLGDFNSLQYLMPFVKNNSAYSEKALKLVMRTLPVNQAKKLVQDLQEKNKQRLVIQAAGILGEVAAVPWLLQQMVDQKMARLAGESFSLITGVEIANSEFEVSAHEDLPDMEEESEDETNDDDLPWPNVGKISMWYKSNQSRFEENQRYLVGQIINAASCEKLTKVGYQPQREAAELELITSDNEGS